MNVYLLHISVIIIIGHNCLYINHCFSKFYSKHGRNQIELEVILADSTVLLINKVLQWLHIYRIINISNNTGSYIYTIFQNFIPNMTAILDRNFSCQIAIGRGESTFLIKKSVIIVEIYENDRTSLKENIPSFTGLLSDLDKKLNKYTQYSVGWYFPDTLLVFTFSKLCPAVNQKCFFVTFKNIAPRSKA